MSVKTKVIGLSLLFIVLATFAITWSAVQNFNQALVEETKKNLLTFVNDKANIVHKKLEDYGNLLKSVAGSDLAEESLVAFSKAFYKLSDEVKVDKQELENQLIEHYDKEYLDKVNYNIEDAPARKLTNQYLPSNLDGKIAQKIFILDNPNPIGEKNKLLFDPKYEQVSYMKVHHKYHDTFNTLLDNFDLYDIFLVNMEGDIVYTTHKEKDFATNLRRDVYKMSALGRAYFKSLKLKKGEIIFEDLSFYEPSYNAPAGFIASPIYINGKVAGSLIFQLPLGEIGDILKEGIDSPTEEVYIVGQDYRLRTELRFKDQIRDKFVKRGGTTILLYEMENEYIKEALTGMSGTGEHKNYIGNDTITVYSPIDVLGTRWAIVGEIAKSEATEDADSIIRVIISVSLVSLLIVAALIFFFVDKFMSAPLQNILDTTENISRGEGDLTKRLDISSKDEFGEVSENINFFIARIQDLINDVKDLADHNIEIAENVDKLSNTIASRIKVENLTINAIAENAKNTSLKLRESKSNISETKEIIVDSNHVLLEAKDEIQQLADKVGSVSKGQKELSEKLSTLSENAEKIKDVLYVIDDIADQTNLLALNAAIEAARAGEQGRGFAVVAYEVTKLADKTQESLADVNKIVSVVLDEMREAVSLMNQSSTSISQLASVSADASRRITDTSQNISNSAEIIETTVVSVVDSTHRITEIVEKIEQITKLSNENTKAIEKMLKRSKELNESSLAVNEKLKHYKS